MLFPGRFLRASACIFAAMQTEDSNHFQARCGSRSVNAGLQDFRLHPVQDLGHGYYHIHFQHKNYQFQLRQHSDDFSEITLQVGKHRKTVQISGPLQLLIRNLGYGDSKSKYSDALMAPMPGMVLDVAVKPGDSIKKGDALLTLEAMKMENILKAQHDGKIEQINVSKGDKVEKNQILITFIPE